ncbi:MAG: HlyC/CorC family transporter [Anaerolineae bacterium]|nr:HlyC/CorC family transporter [Anaerolineae bacterium]
MDNIALELVIIFVLLLVNGFFSGSEIAIVSARRSRLEAKANEGSGGAKTALKLSKNPDRFLATVQIGITLIGTISSAFGGARLSGVLAQHLRGIPAVAPHADAIAFAVVVILLTYFSLIIGELVPKKLALKAAESFAIFTAPIMSILERIATPIVGFLTFSMNVVLRLLGQKESETAAVTEEDIVYMVRAGTESGAVGAHQADLIEQVFDFADRQVKTVMTPRPNMIGVDIAMTLDEIADIFAENPFSRLPVYEEHIDNVIGVLHAKDIVRLLRDDRSETLKSVIRQPAFIVETDLINHVLEQFRETGIHIAIIIDEYGQTAGMITMQDLLEELVGSIRDETDVPDPDEIVRREDGSWLISGMTPFDKVQDETGLPMPPDLEDVDFNTIAGLVLAVLSRIPTAGDTLETGGYRIEVVDMDERRVDKVLITPPESESNAEDQAPTKDQDHSPSDNSST